MSRCTLVFDESGKFDQPGEQTANFVGGMLIDGGAKGTDERFRGVITSLKKSIRKLHWADMKAHEKQQAQEQLSQVIAKCVDCWLFVVAPPESSGEGLPKFSLHLRLVRGFVDLAARLARPAREVDVRPARRTLDGFTPEQAALLLHRGLATERPADENNDDEDEADERGVVLRGLVQADSRVAIEEVAREGGPALASIEVRRFGAASAHAGLYAADFACGFLRGLLDRGARGDKAFAGWPGLQAKPPFVVAFAALPRLRELDRALMARTPDLLRAAQFIERLEGTARASTSKLALADEGAARAARFLFDRRVAALATEEGVLRDVAALLSASVRGALDAKTGENEGTWLALEAAWFGDGALATSLRATPRIDRELRARLHRATIECANHRGDYRSGRIANERFRAELAKGGSLVLLAEALVARNVGHVCLQNELPCAPADVATVTSAIRADAAALEAVVKTAEEAVEYADKLAGVSTAPSPPPDRRIWTATKREPESLHPDLEVGRCTATIARTCAFLGDHDQALTLALRARNRFTDSAFDLTFNATVIARILAEAGRVGRPDAEASRVALDLCGGAKLSPAIVHCAIDENPAVRFALDALFRTMLWVPGAVDEKTVGAWRSALARGVGAELHRTLSRLPSHPSELVARHAGELVKGPARGQWLSLSLELSEASPDGAIRNFAHFTRALLEGRPVDERAHDGSWDAPTFEYR